MEFIIKLFSACVSVFSTHVIDEWMPNKLLLLKNKNGDDGTGNRRKACRGVL